MVDLKAIPLGKHSVDYYFRWSSKLGLNPPRNSERVEIADYLSRSESVRRIDVHLPWRATLPLFLHWSDGTDLERLDLEICKDEPYYFDFDGAVVATDTPVKCPTCPRRYLTLTVETSVSPVRDMIERYRAHKYIESCPSCNSPWRKDIVSIIAESL
ncbi:hypothetical protein [Nocardia sp. NRRL WC-3656]|uniref:hypothetical protein n=1 Tax=Nocardia sp. NRRL WC-3656 TaxID=1463824 RepID=UPI0012DEFF44|nr:hypothetical protein [Nocardia sp. NRRL WC-3656]